MKIKKMSTFNILVTFILMFIIILNFFNVGDRPEVETGSILISSSLKCSHMNLIQNFACRKSKLTNCTVIFPNCLGQTSKTTLVTLILILSNDIELNPGPRNASIFPCGYCEHPVNWSDQGVCCDECGIWHHKSCGDISSKEMEYLERSSVVWLCCKCESVNVDTFTFHSYELYTSNLYAPLSGSELSIDSIISSSPFSPLHTSSPHTRKDYSKTRLRSHLSSDGGVNSSHMSDKSHSDFLPKQTNLRLLTVNCCSVREHKAEFLAGLDYVKPDLICGTESWLKGVKPGKEPSKNAIKSSEIFPNDYIFHRNDRMSRGGGVFTGVKKNLVATEQTELITECEIEWTKVKMKSNKDLYLSSFYMPHRNLKDLQNLDQSLKKLSNSSKSKHILLAGDLNCPDINWENLTVRPNALDREIQQALIDISTEHGLTWVHNQPTRQDNILDLSLHK